MILSAISFMSHVFMGHGWATHKTHMSTYQWSYVFYAWLIHDPSVSAYKILIWGGWYGVLSCFMRGSSMTHMCFMRGSSCTYQWSYVFYVWLIHDPLCVAHPWAHIWATHINDHSCSSHLSAVSFISICDLLHFTRFHGSWMSHA